MLDRTIPPTIHPILNISYPTIEKASLSNGIPLHLVRDNSLEVVRIDFMFEGGAWNQPKSLVSFLTNQMLKEGTLNFTSQDISEKMDFYGSWLQLSASYHFSYLTVYCLSKYVKETLAIIDEMIKLPVFPQTEFDVLLNNRKQQFLLDNEKVQSLANRRFSSCIYGSNHPYGKTALEEDFDTISIEDLKKFYKDYYRIENMQIVLSGNINDAVISNLEEKFGKEKLEKKEQKITQFISQSATEKKHFIPKEDAVQSAIKIGRVAIERNHPDYPYLKIVTTLFGGYFGSRLMSNIREDKGYTYGIGASLSAVREGGAFAISTEAATVHVQPLIKEVFKEMDLLCKEEVGVEELEMVKNVMLGDAVRLFDGTFSIADACLSLIANDLEISFYKKQVQAIHDITPQQIQHLAQKYFVKEEFYQIIAGKE